MKKPLLSIVLNVFALLAFVASVLSLMRGDAVYAVAGLFSGLVMLGLGELVGHLANTAYQAARAADLLEKMDVRQMRVESKERQAAFERANGM